MIAILPARSPARALPALLAVLLVPTMALAACAPAEPEAPIDGAPSAAEEGAAVEGANAQDDALDEGAPDATAAVEGAAGESDAEGPLVVYSGRAESLVGPLLERYREATGEEIEVRYGGTAELAATILEEGDRSPADLFYAQDPGGLGAVADRLAPLPAELLERVDRSYRHEEGRWIGVSGRLRVVVYNTERVSPEDLPEGLEGFTDPAWRGRVGWPPTNASFQTMVTGARAAWGDEATRAWLEAMVANETAAYESNTPLVAAVAAGEVDAGLVNHYYLHRFLAEEGEGFGARNHVLSGGGPGSLLMVSGAGILASSTRPAAARRLLEHLLGEEGQRYFARSTFEYPLAAGVEPAVELPALADLDLYRPPLGELADLRGTAAMLQEVGALP